MPYTITRCLFKLICSIQFCDYKYIGLNAKPAWGPELEQFEDLIWQVVC